MTSDEFRRLLTPCVRELIEAHRDDEPSGFVMRFHGRNDLPVRAVAEQIACGRKAARKLPGLSKHGLIYTSLSLEQASGERAAAFKANLLDGERILDMSGGLGIDAFFFSRRFREVVYCERDEVLAGIATRNFRELGASTIDVRQGDGVHALGTFPDDHFDWIYLDPARRERGRRSVTLEAASPDAVALHDVLLRKACNFCVKASPVLETEGLKEKLPSLYEVLVVSVDGECKETLLLCGRKTQREVSVRSRAVCLKSGSEPFVVSGDAGGFAVPLAAAPGEFFYEPDPAIIKARLTPVLARRFGLRCINRGTDYLTSAQEVEGFPGRSFRVLETLPYKPKTVKKFLENRGFTGASIQRRDFPLSPEEIRRKFRLKESDTVYLFFTKDADGKLLCVCCTRLRSIASV